MRAKSIRRRAGLLWTLVLAAVALGAGCSLDEAPAPDPVGPSDAGVSVDLVAAPDVLNADGVSQSVVRVVLRDNRGRPIAGRSVLFEHDGDGVMSPSSASTFVGPVQSGLVMSTDRDGTAFVVYVAGTRLRSVIVAVRPYGIDSTYYFYRTIEIIQR